MRTEVLIRMQASSEKGHSKAMQVAAAIDGVESVMLAGEDRSLLRVVGEGVDSSHLTSRLRRKVGHADIVELRTLHAGSGHATAYGGAVGGGYHSAQNGDAVYDQYISYPATISYSPAAADDQGYYIHQHLPSYDYHPPPAPYPTTVVLQEYPAGDPTGCSIM